MSRLRDSKAYRIWAGTSGAGLIFLWVCTMIYGGSKIDPPGAYGTELMVSNAIGYTVMILSNIFGVMVVLLVSRLESMVQELERQYSHS